jgi:hypothetical protein
VWRAALHLCAAAVVFVHNHPSGDPAPSAEDGRSPGRKRPTGGLSNRDIAKRSAFAETIFRSTLSRLLLRCFRRISGSTRRFL